MALIGWRAAISGITSSRIVIVIVGSLLMLLVPLVVMFGAPASNVLAQILRVVWVMIVALGD